MKFDRNTILGFLVLGALFVGYFLYNSNQQAAFKKKQEKENAYKDSVARANRGPIDTVALKTDSARADSTKRIAEEGVFHDTTAATEKLVVMENKVMKVTFTSKGAQPKKIELKNFKGPDSTLVRLAASDFDKINYTVNTGKNAVGQSSEFYFQDIDSVINKDGSKTLSFTKHSTDSSSGSSIVHRFTIPADDYMMDFTVHLAGSGLLTNGLLNLTWQYTAARQESDISFEKQNTQVGYVKDGSFDYHTVGRRSSKEFDESVKWVGIRQRFFMSAIVARNNFSSGRIEWTVPPDTANTIVRATANMKLQVPVASEVDIPFNIYYGPSDFKTLKKYDLKFEKVVNLGQGMYAFVRPLNKFLILPTFDTMQSWVGNYGIAILLLTLVIRLLISPLTYSSYLSGAKMKVLRPEIAKLKEKHGKDQQAMSMEQMKLFREAGVNPLGGCIPALLQIPIFFALYSFFNSQIGLRGANFLWSKDLSAFDDVIKFGTHIPLLGSHLSMFTITAVLTSFLISIYSMSMSPDQSNPVLKYMPYIFPVFLLFIFNRLPAALTWYYTVSNIITLILQFIIQNYIIDHDKILAKMEQNRKKPKTKSKWQERMEQMQEQQKKMKETQQKNKRK
jgi:YidC/Oxa1 family membrane protein insertase